MEKPPRENESMIKSINVYFIEIGRQEKHAKLSGFSISHVLWDRNVKNLYKYLFYNLLCTLVRCAGVQVRHKSVIIEL